jgi:hypothetical protein
VEKDWGRAPGGKKKKKKKKKKISHSGRLSIAAVAVASPSSATTATNLVKIIYNGRRERPRPWGAHPPPKQQQISSKLVTAAVDNGRGRREPSLRHCSYKYLQN